MNGTTIKKIAVDSDGKLILSAGSLNDYALKSEALLLDQTTPQTVSNGSPDFAVGLTAGTGKFGAISDGDYSEFETDGALKFNGNATIKNGKGGNSLKIIANAVTATDALELTGGYIKSTGGILGTITTVTDTYTVLYTDQTIICDKATAFTVTLPAAVVGQRFNIKNIGAGTVTLEGDGSDTIDGDLNQAIYQWEGVQVQCYASNKWGVL
jgi:hypothetical protein